MKKTYKQEMIERCKELERKEERTREEDAELWRVQYWLAEFGGDLEWE